MKKKIVYICILFATIAPFIHAQHAIGSWQNYLSYHNVTRTEPAGNIIYALGNGDLFSYDKEDTSIRCYWKGDILSDTDISYIAYNKEYKTLIIIYSNANIDLLINDTEVYNLPDYMNKNMTQDKTVTHIAFNKEYAYLSTSFGIMVLNLKNREITNTYILNKQINASAVDDNQIYAASSEGLFTGLLTDNLLDPGNWNKVSESVYSHLSSYNDEIIGLASGQGIFLINKSDYSYSQLINGHYSFMYPYGDKLIAGSDNSMVIFNDVNDRVCIDHFLGVIVHFAYENGIYWAGGQEEGLMGFRCDETNNTLETVVSSVIPNSPKRNYPYYMVFAGERLLITGGGINSTYLNREGTIMTYENNTWDSFQEKNDFSIETGVAYTNITSIAQDPMDEKHHFASSARQGLYEFYDKKLVKHYSVDKDSPLQSGLPNSTDKINYVCVNGLRYDNEMNLWMLNSSNDKHVHILDRQGQWQSFHYDEILTPLSNFEHTLFDRRGWFWALSTYRSRSGILCLNTDDRTKHSFLTSFVNQDGNTFHEKYYCIAEDREGVIWIGTETGPIILNNPSQVFEDDFTCTQIKVPRNDGTNLADFLLINDVIKTIAIDAANRKWIGTTSSGLYLLSADGLETIHHFTEDNSPLLSNSITSLAIHPRTGEVFIGTSKGLVSYQSDATEPKENLVEEEVYAYPNPVTSDYTGVITITGLVEDTDIKITNVSGKLVHAGTSVGGQFTWDGRNMQGNKVPSGIYFVLAADQTGKQGVATKILIVR